MITQKIIAAGILPLCPKTGRVCLNLRGKDQPQPLQWSCWGGKFEDDEDLTPKDCAKREFYEETRCVSPYSISKKEFFMHDTNQVQFWTYLGIFENEFIPDIESENEAEDWGWFKIEKLPEPLLQGFQEMLDVRSEDLIRIVEKLK